MDIISDCCSFVKNQLLYVVYGDDIKYQIETKLSVLSVLRHTNVPSFVIRIITDQPQAYEGWPVEVIAINQAVLRSWLADTQYHYRCKLMGIVTLLPYAERTVFLDTDTLVTGDANQLFGYSTQEILVDKIFTQWRHYFNDALVGNVSQYLLKNHPKRYEHDTVLFNSGVLGLCKSDLAMLKDALVLIDELWPIDKQCRVLEQFCIAISINNQKKVIEQRSVYHYWSKKIFFQQAGKYFFDTHGYDYKETYPELSKEISTCVIRPHFIKRFILRLKIKKFPIKKRRGVLKLLYALNLSGKDYEGAQRLAYWLSAMEKNFIVDDPEVYNDFLHGRWPENYKHLVPLKQQQAFMVFLNTKQAISQL